MKKIFEKYRGWDIIDVGGKIHIEVFSPEKNNWIPSKESFSSIGLARDEINILSAAECEAQADIDIDDFENDEA